ncbi:unnamed protein product [Chilo suppressalis]|uniref:Uncharacterized protein n=1 Tax=Chilo suppressalis TaxID=168631 RepID=A0ABN8B227_CHISP|nr:hypothetical protein evm_006487 [Chilo suppressalis]CAH0399875.1 unnamed protein product [Chilo suppressalis]
MLSITVFLCSFLGVIYSNNAASVTKCQASDSSCIKQSAQALLPLLAKGKLAPELRTLDPLHIEKIDATQQNLQLIARDITVKGLKECTVDSISRDGAKSKLNVNILCTVVVEGEYDVKGKILVLKLDGQGHLIVKLTKVLMSVEADLEEIEKSGKKYWNIKNWDSSYTIKEKANIELTNLFNGSEELTQAIRDVFGASANEIVTEIGPPIIKAITTEVVNTVNDFFHLTPIDELVLN